MLSPLTLKSSFQAGRAAETWPQLCLGNREDVALPSCSIPPAKMCHLVKGKFASEYMSYVYSLCSSPSLHDLWPPPPPFMPSMLFSCQPSHFVSFCPPPPPPLRFTSSTPPSPRFARSPQRVGVKKQNTVTKLMCPTGTA